MLNYQDMRDLIEQVLQDTTNATYGTTELNLMMDNALKEFSPYAPHIVDVIFRIESRTGTDVTGTASSLSDLVKDQFLAADATNEKVVHNITDDTWAVVLTRTSAEVLTLSADIMDANEQYEIYNKRCENEKQIYIGDVLDYLWIDSVEYPIGEKRNWKVYGEVLEIDVDSVDDSDSTLTTLGQVDVLVRFAKPHRLNQLTDWDGEVNLQAGYSKGDAAMAFDGITGTVEVGDEFNLENHRTLYTVTVGGTATMTFYPGLEADVTDNDDINFVKSTLKPHHEEIVCYLVVARAMLSQAEARHKQAVADLVTGRAKIPIVNKGGVGTAESAMYAQYANAELTVANQLRGRAERKLAEVIGKMEALSPPRTKRRYSTA